MRPRPGSPLLGAALPTGLRRLGAAVVVLWLPPLLLTGYLLVTIVYAVVAVLLVPFLPPFVLGLLTARGRPANPDLAIWGLVTGAWTTVVCVGAAINEQWFHHARETSHLVVQIGGAGWAALATLAVWRLRRGLRDLERGSVGASPWPPPEAG